MTQYNLPVFASPTPGRTFLKDNLEPWRDAVHSMHAGVVRPDYVVPQMMWIDTSATPWVLKVFQGSDDIVLGSLDPVTLNFTPSAVDGAAVTGVLASNVTATNTNGLTSTNVQGQLDQLATDPYAKYPIGVPFPLRVDLGVTPPDNSGTAKYIELTYGKSGAGGYNEGLITGEVTSGTFPNNLVATGNIVGGVMNGKTVRFINTMQLFMRGAETGGTLQRDAIRNIVGEITNIGSQNTGTASGAFTRTALGGAAAGNVGANVTYNFDASAVVPTASENRVQNEGATFFMRII